MASSSGRILLDIPCKVCHDHSSGKHYGIFACDGCAGFFKRSIRRNRQYVCKNRGTGQEGSCMVDKTHRNQCRACRLARCAQVGMNKDAVQHERGPRNSTLRRQMALYFKENTLGCLGGAPGHTNEASSKPFMPPRPTLPPPMGPITGWPTFGGLLAPSAPFFGIPRPPFPIWSPVTSMEQANVFGAGSVPLFVSTAAESLIRPAVQSPLFGSKKTSNGIDLTLKEQTARLLFMTLHWPKSLPQFLQLNQSDQLSALRQCWPSLFLLASSQFHVLTEDHVSGLTEKHPHVEQMDSLRQILSQLDQLKPDAVEFSCLRALILLKSVLASPMVIEQIQLTLARYEQLQHSGQPLRSVKLLMLLPVLDAVPAELLEELFFKESIGDVPMSRLVCDLYSAPDMTHYAAALSMHSSPATETSVSS